MPLLEEAIERELVRASRALGVVAVKLGVPGHRGWPDRLLLAPGARVLFVECKRPGVEPPPHQRFIHEALRRFGFVVEVVDSVERARVLPGEFARG